MALEFLAAIYKVQTLADGGIRLTLDLPEDAIIEAAQLMTWKRDEEAVHVKVTTDDDARIQRRD